MSIFYCKSCKKDFEKKDPQKKEYNDPIYGYCWKYIAFCPDCDTECSEKSKPKRVQKEQISTKKFPPGFCPKGGCCCG